MYAHIIYNFTWFNKGTSHKVAFFKYCLERNLLAQVNWQRKYVKINVKVMDKEKNKEQNQENLKIGSSKTENEKDGASKRKSRCKTTTKFSTMVPKPFSSEVEVTQDESQLFDMSNDEDFVSASSQPFVNLTESQNSIYSIALNCQEQANDNNTSNLP